VLVAKFLNHLPLYRQQAVFELTLPRFHVHQATQLSGRSRALRASDTRSTNAA
jgi:hypothetical protein